MLMLVHMISHLAAYDTIKLCFPSTHQGPMNSQPSLALMPSVLSKDCEPEPADKHCIYCLAGPYH